MTTKTATEIQKQKDRYGIFIIPNDKTQMEVYGLTDKVINYTECKNAESMVINLVHQNELLMDVDNSDFEDMFEFYKKIENLFFSKEYIVIEQYIDSSHIRSLLLKDHKNAMLVLKQIN